MARSSPRPSMACSFCAPQSRADDAMVAQELDQLMGTVLEGPTKAVVTMEFLGFFRQHPVHGPGTFLRTCLSEFQEGMPATGPRADRGRANAGETAACMDLAASGLAPSYLSCPVPLALAPELLRLYQATPHLCSIRSCLGTAHSS
jgi:hypothetical protein